MTTIKEIANVICIICAILNIGLAGYNFQQYIKIKKKRKEYEKFYNQKIEKEVKFIKTMIESRRNVNHVFFVLAGEFEEARDFFETLVYEDDVILQLLEERDDLK